MSRYKYVIAVISFLILYAGYRTDNFIYAWIAIGFSLIAQMVCENFLYSKKRK